MKRLAGKPFVLLGINSDKDRAAIRTTLQEKQITWRSWWDNGSKSGPIQTKWQVERRPAIYVLDANGVIRYKNTNGVDEEDLDEIIDSLLEEFAATSRNP